MPTLPNPRRYAMLLLAMLLMIFPPLLRAESTTLSPEAQAKLAPEYDKLAEIEMSAEDAEKQAQAIESIVLIVGDDIAVKTTREVTAVYAPLAKDGLRWRKLGPWVPWIVAGSSAALLASFVGGVILGAK